MTDSPVATCRSATSGHTRIWAAPWSRSTMASTGRAWSSTGGGTWARSQSAVYCARVQSLYTGIANIFGASINFLKRQRERTLGGRSTARNTTQCCCRWRRGRTPCGWSGSSPTTTWPGAGSTSSRSSTSRCIEPAAGAAKDRGL